MIIYGATNTEILAAINKVSLEYDENIISDRFECLTLAGKTFAVKLRCKSSKGKGAKRSADNMFSGGRRTVSCCWHVVEAFYDALPEGVRIVSKPPYMNIGKVVNFAGNKPYETIMVGNYFMQQDMRDLCEC